VYKIPAELTDEQVLFLADILPTSYEVGVLNGMVAPGDTVAIVGAGPIGLAAILTATLYTPGRIVAIDLADSRLESARRFGADPAINNGSEDAVARVMELTDGLGADVALEAVGVPQTFELATELIRPGGHVANIGVHGKPATLHLEKLWIRDVTVTTGGRRRLNPMRATRHSPHDSAPPPPAPDGSRHRNGRDRQRGQRRPQSACRSGGAPPSPWLGDQHAARPGRSPMRRGVPRRRSGGR
jgi:threonine dehydrogenase-like Zn-dependent dehydrogenase